jgi:ribose 5-phosphate isomerase B
MRIAIGADHAGVVLSELIIAELRRLGHDVVDFGGHDPNSADDYPDYAVAVGSVVAAGRCERGLLVCGSGVGVSVAANKIAGIRAGLCHDTYSAHQGVEHDDMNVICIGARVIGSELAMEIVHAFIAARFMREERHLRRLSKVLAIEAALAVEDINTKDAKLLNAVANKAELDCVGRFSDPSSEGGSKSPHR